jgi:hypothetical protein
MKARREHEAQYAGQYRMGVVSEGSGYGKIYHYIKDRRLRRGR